MQGILGSSATCIHEQRLSPRLVLCRATGEPTDTKPFITIKPVKGTTPVTVGPLGATVTNC